MLRIIAALSFMALISCQTQHQREVDEWRKNRLAELKAPYGWPSVIGLYHLKVSYSFFGRADTNEFIIASENAPSSVGHLEKTDTAIIMRNYQSIHVMVDGERVRTTVMKTDKEQGGPTIASYRNFQWHIIERDDQYYLRMKDTLSSYRSNLTEIPYFPINEEYKITASVIEDRGERPDSIRYENVLGQEIAREVAAYLSFVFDEVEHELVAFDNDDQSYFVLLNDRTTSGSTYGGGRYLYPKKASSDGLVSLDFNKLINPPCVFTPYATCPLPPKYNHLPFEIQAGEKELHLY